MNIFQILQKISLVPSYLWDKMWAPVWKRCMKHCGKGVYIRPMSSDFKGLWNLSVGDGTSIPKGSTIYCTDAPCTIGKKVLFGPKPTIISGDHRIDILGKYMADVTVEEKFVDGVNVYDQPVVIEDDVWCGANVTILKGVTIGHGSVVAAGAVVTVSVIVGLAVFKGMQAIAAILVFSGVWLVVKSKSKHDIDKHDHSLAYEKRHA